MDSKLEDEGQGRLLYDDQLSSESNDPVCPKSNDEPNPLCLLGAGVHVEIFGWSSFIPLKLLNLPPDLRFKTMTDATGDISSSVKELSEKCVPLEEMENVAGVQTTIRSSIFVQVVAKKKVDVISCRNKIMIIPSIVIADESGYCTMCSFNEGLETVYNAVDLGDFLLLSNFKPQKPQSTPYRGLFSNDKALNLEIKIQPNSVRSHFIRKFNPLKLSDFQMLEALFNGCEVKVPAELENEMSSIRPGEQDNAHPFQFYDVVGVISYVGRIERFRISKSVEVEDDKKKIISLPRFVAYRWISLVDKTSKPLWVKIFIYNSTLECQSSVVPGAVTVITHCQTSIDLHGACKYVSTSLYSEINLGEGVGKYFMLRPKSFVDKVSVMIKRSEYCDTVSRKDVQWSVGGSPTMRIMSEEKLKLSYHEKRLTFHSDMFPNFSLSRRESRRLFFRGSILRVMKFHSEGCPTVEYIHPRYVEEVRKKKTLYKGKVLENFQFYSMNRNISWYSFIRKLPPLDQELLKLDLTCQNTTKRIVSHYKKYCEPLLIPSKMNSKSYPPMADLEIVDGTPCVILDIVDEKTPAWYTCLWKTSSYSVGEMLAKVQESEDKVILGVADIFCVEEGFPWEVVLHDFVSVGDHPGPD